MKLFPLRKSNLNEIITLFDNKNIISSDTEIVEKKALPLITLLKNLTSFDFSKESPFDLSTYLSTFSLSKSIAKTLLEL